MASVAPTTWPPLMPPPAIHIVKPRLWWSRPRPDSASGERPNSPPQTTSVLSSRPATLQVLEQAGDGPVGLGGLAEVVLLDVVVGVPLQVARPAARDDADEPDPVLDELPGQQAAAAVVVGRLAADPVEVERLAGLAGEVEDVGRLGLHPEGQVVGVDPGGELLVGRVERRPVQVADRARASAAAARARRPGGRSRLSTGRSPGRNIVGW